MLNRCLYVCSPDTLKLEFCCTQRLKIEILKQSAFGKVNCLIINRSIPRKSTYKEDVKIYENTRAINL